jgi:hypothetical protein
MLLLNIHAIPTRPCCWDYRKGKADVSSLVRHVHRLAPTPKHVAADIDIFVRHAVRSLIASRELMIRESSLEDEIIEKLASGAKGM